MLRVEDMAKKLQSIRGIHDGSPAEADKPAAIREANDKQAS